jgi:hypothetical protein
VAEDLSFTIQIGTNFDLGQDLVWTLKSDPLMSANNVSVPRPKRYRKTLPDLVESDEAMAITNKEIVTMVGLDPEKVDKKQHLFLSLIDPMQREEFFCPAGDWRTAGEVPECVCPGAGDVSNESAQSCLSFVGGVVEWFLYRVGRCAAGSFQAALV